MADRPKYSYVGKLPCGCVIAAVVDDPTDAKFTAQAIADFVKEGLTIERVPHQYVRDNFIDIDDCPHREKKPVQQSLFSV